MTILRTLVLAVLLATGPLATARANGSADVQACKAMAAKLGPVQAEIAKLKQTRDEAAETVETTGEAWDDAEVMRRASAGHAATADTAKAAYDDAKNLLAARELALQSSVSQFNDDVTAYNTRCTKK